MNCEYINIQYTCICTTDILKLQMIADKNEIILPKRDSVTYYYFSHINVIEKFQFQFNISMNVSIKVFNGN